MQLIALIIVSLSIYSAAESGPASLPVPTGKFKIGRSSMKLSGEPIIVWYPAQAGGRVAPYASNGIIAELKKSDYYQQSPQTIESWSTIATHSSEDAKPIANRSPLLIFLPGAGVVGFQYTTFAEEFASRGFMVVLLDYFSPDAPKRNYDSNDFAAMENDMAREAVSVLKTLAASPEWQARIRLDRVGILGHSIGGAASIAAARIDQKFTAASDMDGAPFGDSLQGATVPLLVLRSKPIYSDADLAKRGATREQWDKKGEAARKVWLEFQAKSGTDHIDIYSVKGTGHFSFSDAPFVMPDAITRFGGEIIAPQRGYKVITTCLTEFFDHHLGNVKAPPQPKCTSFEEIVSELPSSPAR